MLPLDNTYIVIYWTNVIFYLPNEHQLAIISFKGCLYQRVTLFSPILKVFVVFACSATLAIKK